MSQRVLAMDGLPAMEPGSRSEFCKHPGCFEWAQSADPTIEDTLKYYCPQHEAAARARGETGERKPLPPEFRDWVGQGIHSPPVEKEKQMPAKKPVAAYNDAGELVGVFESATAAAKGNDALVAVIGTASRAGSRVRATGLRYRQVTSADDAPKNIGAHATKQGKSPQEKPKPAHTRSAPAAPVAVGPAARPSEPCGREPAGPVETKTSSAEGSGSAGGDLLGDVLEAFSHFNGAGGGTLRVLVIERTF